MRHLEKRTPIRNALLDDVVSFLRALKYTDAAYIGGKRCDDVGSQARVLLDELEREALAVRR